MMALLNTLPYGDSIRNVEYYSTNDFINNQSALAELEHTQSLNILYIVSIIVLVIIAVAIWYLQNLKSNSILRWWCCRIKSCNVLSIKAICLAMCSMRLSFRAAS